MVRQRHLSGFGDNGKRIFEDVLTAQLNDAIRQALYINVGRFGNDLCEVLIGTRIIVRPSRSVEFTPCRILPARDDQFARVEMEIAKR